MRLSEAIRLGATMRPQAFGVAMFNGRSCAMGAASEALGITIEDFLDWPADIRATFRLLRKCPVCQIEESMCAVAHVNDVHRWTREQIADWVELHEPLPVPESVTEETSCQLTK